MQNKIRQLLSFTILLLFILASIGEDAHPADIEALKQNKLKSMRPAHMIRKDLEKMHADLKSKQQLVAEIAVKYKNDEIGGGKKADEMEKEVTENGKSLSAMKEELNELSLKIAEHQHLLERTENIEKVMSTPRKSRDLE